MTKIFTALPQNTSSRQRVYFANFHRFLREHRSIFLSFIFAFIATLSFLAVKNLSVSQAKVAGFDPGNIMSDYVMSNTSTMTEADIQQFLKSKNPCNNTNIHLANYYPHLQYNIRDGHFVCMADDTFNGETAAHIIWQAAQDYKINPQVILVLLEKEQGLISDTWPNHVQYRTATGYGCPDTAPCDAQYFGLKNQIRKAAALFREVLDGGWTNYPLGNTYVQYNPDPACGGSYVNIRSRATSALYRYTPYQPNAGALAAHPGTAHCGAYGNRNFYSFFTDWFGSTRHSAQFISLERPRFLTTKGSVPIIDATTEKVVGYLSDNTTFYYKTKTIAMNSVCLRTKDWQDQKSNKCIKFSDLQNTEIHKQPMEIPRYLQKTANSKNINPSTLQTITSTPDIAFYRYIFFVPTIGYCLAENLQSPYCTPYSSLKEVSWNIQKMDIPRLMKNKNNVFSYVNPNEDKIINTVSTNQPKIFDKKIILPDGQICLLPSNHDLKNGCIKFNDLSEVWTKLDFPRKMVINKNTYKQNAHSFEVDKSIVLAKGLTRTFVSKIYNSYIGGMCLRTEYDENLNTDNCIKYEELDEDWQKMKFPQEFIIHQPTYKFDAHTFNSRILPFLEYGTKRKYVEEIKLYNGESCLRTEYDSLRGNNYCVLFKALKAV